MMGKMGMLKPEMMDQLDENSLMEIIRKLNEMIASKGSSMKSPMGMSVEIEASKDPSDVVDAGVMDANDEDDEDCISSY